MSTPTATQQPAPHSAIRRLVARHPAAAFLVMVYTVSFAFTLPPVRAQLDILPSELPLWSSLGALCGVALPAFLVIAAAEGRAGVRGLARRCLRWHVGARWYLVALLGVPRAIRILRESLDPGPMRELEERLSEIRDGKGRLPPVRLFWAREDTMLPPAFALRYQKLLPAAELVWFDRASHFLHVDDPERTVREIVRFAI